METETRVVASVAQAEQLIKDLEMAIANVRDGSKDAFASTILEQMDTNGPWRIVIGLMPTGVSVPWTNGEPADKEEDE